MIYWLIALCILLFAMGYLFSKQNVFSPVTITAAIWIVCLSLFLLLHHDLPPLSGRFFGSLALWISTLSIGSFCVQSFRMSNTSTRDANIHVRNIFLLISTICYPFLFIWAKQALAVGDTGNWALDLRMAAIGQSALGDDTYGGLNIILWNITYTVELIYFTKKTWWRTALPALYVLSFGFLTMSKIMFLSFFVMTLCILFFNKKIQIKHIAIGFIFLLTIMVSLQSIRHRNSLETEDQKEDFLVLYALSSMSAFDTLEPCSSNHWGENAFRIYYAITYKLGLSEIKPINPLLDFIDKPIVTNTYTGMYPFFKDFGKIGVGIFGLILGILFGFFFRKAQKGSIYCMIIYAYLSQAILMQYAADSIFTGLANFVKYMIIASLLFIPAKFTIKKAEIQNTPS